MQQVNLPKQNKQKTSSSINPTITNGLQNSQPNSNLPQSNLNNIQSNNNLNVNMQAQQNNNIQNNRPAGSQSNGSSQQPLKNDYSDPWGSTWDDPWGAKSQQKEKKLTPQERTEMITKIYMDVLGREPDTRDINYYKYSTLGESEIYKQILTGKEHKKLVADGKDFKNMNTRASQSEIRVKVLEGQIKDQVVEFRQLTELLQEKNRYINQLRSSSHNPYSFTTDAVNNVKKGHIHYSQEQSPLENQNVNISQNQELPVNNSKFPQPSQFQSIQSISQGEGQLQIDSGVKQQNSRQHSQNQAQQSNVQFGNVELTPPVPVKRNKFKEFIKTILDL